MAARDVRLVTSVLREPFTGYSRRAAWAFALDANRIVACVALLSAMVLSGIALGAPERPARLRS